MIRRLFIVFAMVSATLLAECSSLCAGTTNAAPNFKEVYDLLHAHLPGATDQMLNRDTVEGLLAQLHGRAAIVSGPAKTAASQNRPAIGKATVLEGNVAYVRINNVANGLADKLSAACHALTATNKVAGMVLDLRFAGGDDYAAAAATADLFVTKKMPLLNAGNGMVESEPGKKPIAGPLVVLVNGETRGAAEALAAILQESRTALAIGSPTAAEATIFKEFPLKNGDSLRIATTPVTLGNGAAISRVEPDITVKVNPDDERAYIKNPYAKLARSENLPAIATNDFLEFVDHTSEADLVREKVKAGDNAGVLAPVPVRRKAPPKPVVQDPVLARALDLIKGLAIVREDRF